jgi:hypothetical protein
MVNSIQKAQSVLATETIAEDTLWKIRYLGVRLLMMRNRT